MNYELAKKLKDAGFPQNSSDWFNSKGKYCNPADEICECSEPTLSELIEACGDVILYKHPKVNTWNTSLNNLWVAGLTGFEGDDYLCASEGFFDSNFEKGVTGSTPEEAVANLWLEINK